MTHILPISDYRPADNSTTPMVHPAAPTPLERRQALLAHHVRLVAHGVSVGLFVVGPGGLGKSYSIERTLTSEGIKPVLLNSHVTPLALYRVMYDHRKDKVLWLDDCDSIYSNLQVLGLLRSGLWGQGQRVVTYNSSQLDDLPSSFVFNSRIIFCANQIPKRNPAFAAVVSRVDVFTLSADREEILVQMRKMAADGFDSLTPGQCLEVVGFMEKAAVSRPLSMRLYEPSLRKVEYALRVGIDWRPLVACQLEQLGTEPGVSLVNSRADDVVCLREAIAAHPTSVKQQEETWCSRTRKSRATFFRMKKALQESN